MKRVIVVGASAGGLEALKRLVAQFPLNFPGPVLIVLHMPAHGSTSWIAKALAKSGVLKCAEAKQGEALQTGRIYIAPPDQHMMVAKGKVLLTKGARENRSRPSIDCLFRSAALAYGNKVIGIVLTGYLDDGTVGLDAIDRCGGLCLVQDPSDADYPDMPRNALRQVKRAKSAPIAEMGAVLAEMLHQKPRAEPTPIPDDIAIEAKIAMRVLSDLESVGDLGTQVPFNCPGCGGVLWQVDNSDHLRFRCHTGHSYTAADLLAEQTAKIEETLWVALRMFEEHRNLVSKVSEENTGPLRSTNQERMRDAGVHIERIREMLKSAAGKNYLVPKPST